MSGYSRRTGERWLQEARIIGLLQRSPRGTLKITRMGRRMTVVLLSYALSSKRFRELIRRELDRDALSSPKENQ